MLLWLVSLAREDFSPGLLLLSCVNDGKMRESLQLLWLYRLFLSLGILFFPSRDQPEYVNAHVTECL